VSRTFFIRVQSKNIQKSSRRNKKRGETMNGKEYIEACKNHLKVNSYYKLAIELDIPESEVNFYARGERLPSVYACFKIGECLGIDPSIIMADIASETEKNPKKRDFFKNFIACCKVAVAAGLMISALWSSTNAEDGVFKAA
jgi:hypothetical protein